MADHGEVWWKKAVKGRHLFAWDGKNYLKWFIFRRPFVKRFALCYRTDVLSCLSVCNVGVLWPNSWMDQDETWHAGRPWPWPHCVR